MSRLKGWLARVRAVVRPREAERRMEEEFAFHVEMEARRRGDAGVSPGDAQRQARVTFGGLDRYREEMRDGRGARWLNDAAADLRYACRMLRRSPGLALAIALTLGIGIGVNGFTFGVVDSLIFRPLPARAPSQLVGIFTRETKTGLLGSFGYDDYRDYRDASGAFAGMAGMMGVPLNLVTGSGTQSPADMVWGEIVTENYFSVLDMQPAAGRFFTTDDAPGGASALAVVSYPSWRSRFAGDPNIAGRRIRINGTEFTITGVAPKGFKGLRTFGFWPEIWVPAGMHRTIVPSSGNMLTGRGRGWLLAFGRMHDGWDLERTSGAAALFAGQLERQFQATNRDLGVTLVPARTGFDNPQFVPPTMLTLTSALALFGSVVTLLVICANLANLQLARAAARRREIAIRLALGCARTRLARQLLVETIVVSLPGVCVAAAVVSAAPLVEPLLLPQLQFRVGIDVVPNVRIAAFTAVLAVGAIAMLALLPAWRATRMPIPTPTTIGAARSRDRWRLPVRGVLVVSQLAMSVVLLSAGMLFTRSLLAAGSQDLGFDVRNRLLVSTNVGLQGYDEARGRRFYDDVLTRVRAHPEVVSASWGFPVPFDTHDRALALYVEGASNTRDGTLRTLSSTVGDQFAGTLGLRLIAGRDFDRRDDERAEPVIVVSNALAARLWPRADPIGAQVRLGSASGPRLTVVGVVGDAVFQTIGVDAPARVYLPLRQRYRDWQTLVVHTHGSTRALIPDIREIVNASDPTLPVFGVMTLEEAAASGRAPVRTAASAAGFFGAFALLIAAIGLYAVVTSAVTERTREIGLRLALGSTPAGVVRHVIGMAARLGCWGLLLGLAGAAAVARAMTRLLVGVSPGDEVTFVVVPLALSAVVLAATIVPARRVAKLDPMSALRDD